jgi:prepilin-type N-terminal cleavage/methylation domain-containing protein
MQKRDGFTLIELMIVIAIIAIIAAIAIPGLLSSQRASNERNASASLKTLASAEADFRGNDRDGNKIQDFWTRDVCGLYGLQPVGSSEMIKLIELSVAGSDFAWSTSAAGTLSVTGLAEVPPTTYTVVSPKAGYWYMAMLTDEASNAYATSTNGIQTLTGATNTEVSYNHAKFAFISFPDSFSAGRNAFFINEGNTIFKRTMNGPVKTATATASVGPAATLSVGTVGLVGSQLAEEWPADAVLKLLYSKLD